MWRLHMNAETSTVLMNRLNKHECTYTSESPSPTSLALGKCLSNKMYILREKMQPN